MEDIVFPKKYRSTGNKHWYIVEFVSKKSGTVVEVESSECVYDIGYHSSSWVACDDKKYWEPVEEEHIVSEKEPFPEFDDIEWVMVEAPEFLSEFIKKAASLNIKLSTYDIRCAKEKYEYAKCIYENSKDFKVTWKLKDKINRKLHENLALAMAIGRWLDEDGDYEIDAVEGYTICCTSAQAYNFIIFNGIHYDIVSEATLPDNYEIPEQILQWMKEYENEKN